MYKKNIHVLKSIVETVIFCGKQNLPLRGDRDDRTSTSSNRDDRSSTSSNRDDRSSTSSNRDDRTSTSSNRGNFWAVLEMMAKRDDIAKEGSRGYFT